MIDPVDALVVLRALVFGAAALLFGTCTLLGLYWNGLAHMIREQLSPLLKAAAVFLFLATLAMAPVSTALAGDGWQDALSPSMIFGVMSSTRGGSVLVGRLLLSAFIAYKVVRWEWVTMGMLRRAALAPALYIASFAFTGHTQLHDGALKIAHELNHAVHVLAGSFWVGALPALFCAARMLPHPVNHKEAARLLTRFAYAGTIAVLVIALSGTLNTLLVLGKIPLDAASQYQKLLMMKIAAVAIMLLLAFANRIWLVPRALKEGCRTGLLKTSIAAECAASAAIILLVANFGMLEPV